MLFFLIGWFIYAVIVGSLAKLIHPGEDPPGLLATILVGLAGSFTGGLINFVVGRGQLFHPAGLLMGILGGVLVLFLYKKYGDRLR